MGAFKSALGACWRSREWKNAVPDNRIGHGLHGSDTPFAESEKVPTDNENDEHNGPKNGRTRHVLAYVTWTVE